MAEKGKFIVVEGMSGSGKGAQIALLRKHFPGFYYDFEPSDEMYGEIVHLIIEKRPLSDGAVERCLAFGDEQFDFWKKMHAIVRKVAAKTALSELEVQMLYMADRMYNLENKYIPRLKKGGTVVLDRYFHSTLVYGFSGGVSLEQLWDMQREAFAASEIIDGYWRPDLLLIFDVPAEVAVRRLQSSGKVLDIFEKLGRLGRIRDGYQLLAGRNDLSRRTMVIDADRPMEEIFGIVRGEVEKTIDA